MESYWFVHYIYELDGKRRDGSTCLHDDSCEYFRATKAMAHIKDLLSAEYKKSEGMNVSGIVIVAYQKSSKEEMEEWEKLPPLQTTA